MGGCVDEDVEVQVDKMRTRSSHMEREAIFERESRSRAVNECSWMREKLRTVCEKVSKLFKFIMPEYLVCCVALNSFDSKYLWSGRSDMLLSEDGATQQA